MMNEMSRHIGALQKGPVLPTVGVLQLIDQKESIDTSTLSPEVSKTVRSKGAPKDPVLPAVQVFQLRRKTESLNTSVPLPNRSLNAEVTTSVNPKGATKEQDLPLVEVLQLSEQKQNPDTSGLLPKRTIFAKDSKTVKPKGAPKYPVHPRVGSFPLRKKRRIYELLKQRVEKCPVAPIPREWLDSVGDRIPQQLKENAQSKKQLRSSTLNSATTSALL
ncbi:unnamed protein product [Pleuronectes platessa]|uniref:Uncharacterized protein n=1 Tax=Pleuronectes platessa TaxID=8262 RepID=A0A9N7VHC6_PLEPL|nr:unnamed protein product [Pleuronectes platessa]